MVCVVVCYAVAALLVLPKFYDCSKIRLLGGLSCQCLLCCLYVVFSVVLCCCGVACMVDACVTVQRYACLVVCIGNACSVFVVLCACADV